MSEPILTVDLFHKNDKLDRLLRYCSGALSSTHAEGDVEGHRSALKQDRERIAFLDVTGQALEIHHRPHRLAVELLDHVAALDASFRRRAPILDADHHDTVGRPEVELPRDFGCDGADLEPEHRASAAARPRLLGVALVGGLADLDLDGLLALLTPHLDLRRAVGGGEADGALQVARTFHRAPLELEQDVARLEAGLCRGAVRHYFVDEHALRVLGAERASQLGGKRLDRNAEPPTRHAALVRQRRELERAFPVVELQDGKVGILVHPADLSLAISPVERHHFALPGLLAHVAIRERNPGGIQEDARTEPPLRDAFGYIAE